MYIINKLDKESLKLTSLEILNLRKLHPVVFFATATDKDQLHKSEQFWDPWCKFNCTPFPEESKANTPLGNFLKGTLHSGLERTSFHYQVSQ